MPFYYRQNDDKSFKFEIAGEKSGWSLECLKWLNFMSYDARFKNPDGGQFLMQCCITGEKLIKINNHEYKIDGYVETTNKIYFLEYFGCRKVYSNYNLS